MAQNGGDGVLRQRARDAVVSEAGHAGDVHRAVDASGGENGQGSGRAHQDGIDEHAEGLDEALLGRVADRLHPRLALTPGLLALALPAVAAPTLLLFFLPMAVVALGNGMTQPSAIAAAISVRPQLAGTASGLLGSLQMGAGALATVLAGLTETGAGLATGGWMLAGALGATLQELRLAPV